MARRSRNIRVSRRQCVAARVIDTSLVRLEIVILAVDDLARAVEFYRKVFDWPVVVSAPAYVELAAGSLHVGLYDRVGFGRNIGIEPAIHAQGTPSRTELYLRVADLADAIERLEAAGAQCASPARARPWGDEVAYFLDPDGNVIAIARPTTSTS